ncbi:4-hydroxyphenylacetate 3-hydroxylase N-terminal domain-containing protein [Caballeronia sp. LZ034LL]|uniref:4-hydroxyphenylacetate 3-hydroxylase family protein n=1 Tax=Caballeronia sp. LZ034LL TaxID=3038567 RepID=UPI00285A2B0B|nr:4-hydroxyphenylacetate 3-hydroxylase N-terminal domain-containing protein [Caballeronia sp. LZ034LL]MDR5836352.1 4-hydroxyphenylacetate 3-hydroxylase N-terminal domain-containing protein [Caballeronia sp. LZ034LL]
MALMTGDQYRASLRDGREVYISGERVTDVTTHPASKPMVDAMARMYDLQHDPRYADVFGYRTEDGEMASRVYKLPDTLDDLRNRREMTAAVLNEVSPVIDRFGDETVTPLFVMKDRKDLLDRFDTRYAQNVERWLSKLQRENLFMTSGNTDPKGDRSKQPYQQDDLDMYLRVVEERDDGIVIRGAKYETGACYAHVAFCKPTVGNWIPENRDYAVACIVPLNAPNVRHICRAPLEEKQSAFDHPLSARFDELDTLMVFDNVFVPWENVIFSRQPELANLIRQDLPKWAAQGFLNRSYAKADLLVGTALLLAEQTRLINVPAIREKIATLMGFREGIRSFILASEAAYETSRTGMIMPNQSIQNAGRVFASSNYYTMTQILRDLAGGAAVMAPDEATYNNLDLRRDLEKYYRIGEASGAERLRTLNLAAELTATSFGGRMQAYQMFAESPPPVQAMALFNSFDKQASVARARALIGA